jgi:ribonuclease HII
MPWVVGIDEAGYGPNLGPFVMTSVACRVPEELLGGDLWGVLRPAVRRFSEPDDGRLLVEDSKVVYSAARGLLGLETGVAATVLPPAAGQAWSLADYVEWACPAGHADLRREPWYTGSCRLPVLVKPEDLGPAAERFREACARGQVSWGPVRSVVVCPARFNEILDRWDSKGAVLGHSLAELLTANLAALDPAEPVWFVVDKHGGRNTYAAVLQNALAEGMVVARQEGRERSVYEVLGLPRAVRVTFEPRADANHFGVALTSMLSKYLRELLMLEFNRFWQARVPGLRPTAGYPGDAARFFAEIRPTAAGLGIPDNVLWRRR